MRFTLIILFCYTLLNAATADDLLELGCTTDEECLEFERSKCRGSHCYCTATDSDKHVACKPKDRKLSNIIGGPCTKEHKCNQDHAECDAKTQQCYCAAGYIPSEDRRRCLAAKVPLLGPCELQTQCQAMDKSALCQKSQGSCLCKEHFEAHEGRCLSTLDVSCSNDTSCKALDAFCLMPLNKCACAAGFVHNEKMSSCIASAVYGASCTTDAQCQMTLGIGSSCSNHSCSCQSKYYASIQQESNSSSCEPMVRYGANCRLDKDCQQSKQSNMVCKWAECGCQEHYQVVENERCVWISAGSVVINSESLMMIAPFFWLIYSRI